MASLSDITVAISTNISNFQKGLDRAQRRLQKAGKGFKEAGTTMSQSLTLPLAAAGAASVKAASDYEDAVTQISKVSSQETASKLEGQIREMSASIPVAQSELATLAADAARFGVKGSQNIANFTKTVSKMAATTDLESETAGKALAKISDQADIPRDKIENLSSTIVRLGDSMATSQSEIVAAMSRGTIAARNFGLAGETITGLAARVNEVSESGERAGTRIKRLFQELQEPKKVAKVAEALGMTTEEFRAMREESPREALMAVVRAAGQAGQEGAEMANIFATSSRAALRGLATDTEGLNKVLNKASEEFQNPIALTQQYRKEQQKFSSQLQIALNKLRNVAITIGNKLMPFVLSLVNTIQRGISAFSGLSNRMQDIIIVGAGIAAALGPVLFIFGFFVSNVLPGLIAALSGVAGAFATLFSPVGAIGAALAGAAALIIQNWDEVKQFFQALGVTDALQTLLNVAKKVVQGVIGAAALLFNKVSGFLEGTGATFGQLGQAVRLHLSSMFSFLKSTFNAIIDAGFVLFEGIKSSFGFIINIFSGDMQGALQNLKNIFRAIFTAILNIVTGLIDKVLSAFQSLVKKVPGIGDDMASGIQSLRDSIQEGKEFTKGALGLDKIEEQANNTKDGLKEVGKEAVKQGKKITGSLSFPSLGGGGRSNGSGGGGDDASLSKVTDGGGFSGPSKAKTIPDGALENVKGFARLQDQAAESSAKLNNKMTRQAKRQRRNAVINQKAGQIIGRTMKRTTQQLSKTFAAALTGTQSLAKGMAAFGDFMQKMFQRLIQKVIQLITKLLVVKAIQATLGAATGGLGSGLIGGLTQGAGGLVGNILGGGIGGGGSSGMGGRTINLQQRGDTMRSTLDFNQKKKNRAGVN